MSLTFQEILEFFVCLNWNPYQVQVQTELQSLKLLIPVWFVALILLTFNVTVRFIMQCVLASCTCGILFGISLHKKSENWQYFVFTRLTFLLTKSQMEKKVEFPHRIWSFCFYSPDQRPIHGIFSDFLLSYLISNRYKPRLFLFSVQTHHELPIDFLDEFTERKMMQLHPRDTKETRNWANSIQIQIECKHNKIIV